MIVVEIVMMVVAFLMIVIMQAMPDGVRRLVAVCMVMSERLAMVVRMPMVVIVLMCMLVVLRMHMGMDVFMAVPVTAASGSKGPDQESNSGEHQHTTDDLPLLGHDGVP